MPTVAVCLSASLPPIAALLEAFKTRSCQATGYQGHYKVVLARLPVAFRLRKVA